jgi:WD40 repeat protein
VLLTDVPCADAQCLCFSRDQSQLVVGVDGKVEIVDAETGRRQTQIDLPRDQVAFFVHSAADGSLIVGKGPKNTQKTVLSVYDPTTGREIRTLGEPFFPPAHLSAAFCDRDGLVATLHPERSSAICLYELSSGRLRSNSLAHRANNNNVAFSPVAPLLAVSAEGGVELWNTTTCKEVGFLTGLTSENGPVVFTADGRLVLAVSPEHRTVHVWDIHERRELFTLPLPREQVFNARDWRLAVSPSGHRIALSMTEISGSNKLYLFGGLPEAQADTEAALPNLDRNRSKASNDL